MKKKILLAIVILLPLLAAFFVGRYAYTDRYNAKSNETVVYDIKSKLFGKFMAEGKTTKGKAEQYLKFRSEYYNLNPIFDQELKNEKGEPLYTITIYPLMYTINRANDDGEMVLVKEIGYAVHIYEIQNQKIKDLIKTEDRDSINSATGLKLHIRLTSVENAENTYTDFMETGVSAELMDIFSDNPDDTLVLMGDPKTRVQWGKVNVKVEIIAKIKVSDTELSETTSTFVLDNFSTKMEDFKESDFHEGLALNLSNERPEEIYYKLGFREEVFKKYIWWQVLLAFVGTGLLTGSFYVVWLLEEKQEQEALNRAKNKKKNKG